MRIQVIDILGQFVLMLLVGFTIGVETYESIYPPDAADEDTTIQVPWWKQAGAITNIVFMAVFTMIELYPLLELLKDLYWPRFLDCIGAPKPAPKPAKPTMPVPELVKPRATIDATFEHNVFKDRRLTRVARKAQKGLAFAATTSSAVAERQRAASAGTLQAARPRLTPSSLLGLFRGLSATSHPVLGLGTEHDALEPSAPAPAANLGTGTVVSDDSDDSRQRPSLSQRRILRNVGGANEPRSSQPQLWEMSRREVDLNEEYKPGDPSSGTLAEPVRQLRQTASGSESATAPTTCAEQPEFQVQSVYQFSSDREDDPQVTFASPTRSPASGPSLLSTMSRDDPGLANDAAFGSLDGAPDPNVDVAWDTGQLPRSAVTLHWDETAHKAVVAVHLNDAQLDSELQGRQATVPEIDEAHSDGALRSTGKPQAASALPWRKREYEELPTLKGEADYQWT
jgi:hypothetical protein